jgi:murein DD-endopeptidase MepM/ murein hydrolase activator NlpD
MRLVRNTISSISLCLFCISCTGSSPTIQIITPASTSTPRVVSASKTPSETISPTTTIPLPACDPHYTDYCIVDGMFQLQVPIPESGMTTVDRSYPYGTTADGTRNPHLGVEFYNPSGTPVLAAGDGRVVYAGDDIKTQFNTAPNIYGNLIIIKHTLETQDIYSLYAHLSKIDVVIGQVVSQGEEIGEVGSSGASIGSHLHFELRLDFTDYTSTLNPELLLFPLPNTGVLTMQFLDESGEYLAVRTNIQYFPDRSTVFTSAWQPEPYSADFIHAFTWENIALGNLTSGMYRISYFWDGALFERWVEIVSGKLTLASFVIH